MIKKSVFVLSIYLGFTKELQGLNEEILDFVPHTDLLVVGVFFYIVK